MQSAFSLDSPFKNLSLTLDLNNPLYSKETEPSLPFKLGGVEVMRKADIATAVKKRDWTSIVWRFGEALVRTKDKKEVFYCYDCERKGTTQRMPVLDGTRGARQHLLQAHSRKLDTAEVQERRNLAEVTGTEVFTVVDKFSFEAFKEKITPWSVGHQLALNMLVNPLFRDLISYLDTGLATLLPKGRQQLRKWIVDAYEKEKEKLKSLHKSSRSKIHVSFDIWSAPSWICVICVWGYWIDAKEFRQRRMLGFRRIYASHSGESESEVLLKLLDEYGIKNRVGYFVCDNASSNDAAIKIVLQELFPGIKDVEIAARRLTALATSSASVRSPSYRLQTQRHGSRLKSSKSTRRTNLRE